MCSAPVFLKVLLKTISLPPIQTATPLTIRGGSTFHGSLVVQQPWIQVKSIVVVATTEGSMVNVGLFFLFFFSFQMLVLNLGFLIE